MNARKITDEQISGLRVSSLPTRPAAPASLGGKGYTAAEIKAAFDRLPLYIIARFNLLMEDIEAIGDDSLAAAIKTGIYEGHSLNSLFEDIKSGEILSLIDSGGRSLASRLEDIEVRLSRLENRREQTYD
jgi:hypothetical protein